jgi:hypothetical protein
MLQITSIIKQAPDWLATEFMDLIGQQPYFSVLIGPVAGVLDELYSQLSPLRGVAVQAPQSTKAGTRTVSILCSIAGRHGFSAELAGLADLGSSKTPSPASVHVFTYALLESQTLHAFLTFDWSTLEIVRS